MERYCQPQTAAPPSIWLLSFFKRRKYTRANERRTSQSILSSQRHIVNYSCVSRLNAHRSGGHVRAHDMDAFVRVLTCLRTLNSRRNIYQSYTNSDILGNINIYQYVITFVCQSLLSIINHHCMKTSSRDMCEM